MQIWNALFMDPQFNLPARNIPTFERLVFVGDIFYLFIVDLSNAQMSCKLLNIFKKGSE